MADTYKRTPLPREARPPVAWLALWSLVLIFSPFFGFAWHGKVEEAGLMPGSVVAGVALSAMMYLVIRQWRARRRVPRHISDEWRQGKIVPAEGAASVPLPARFTDNKAWIDIRCDGIVLSSDTILGTQGGLREWETSWATQQIGQRFVPWGEVEEWIVDTDSDGPDCYVLRLRAQGRVKVRRLHLEAADECRLLDAVRFAGHVPVRLLCDVG